MRCPHPYFWKSRISIQFISLAPCLVSGWQRCIRKKCPPPPTPSFSRCVSLSLSLCLSLSLPLSLSLSLSHICIPISIISRISSACVHIIYVPLLGTDWGLEARNVKLTRVVVCKRLQDTDYNISEIMAAAMLEQRLPCNNVSCGHSTLNPKLP